MPIPAEERKDFEDAEKYLKYRKGLEDNFFRGFDGQLIDSESTRNAETNFSAAMRKRLTKAGRPELAKSLIPDFPPHCRRLTPGPGYLEALAAENLTLIQTPIERSVSASSGFSMCADCVFFDGIVTTDGVHRPVDAVICSTGANVDLAPPFPIESGEYDLSRDWKADGKFGWPYTYMGVSREHSTA